MSTITKLAAETKAQFISDNRELFACLSNSVEDIFTRISADLTLDRELNDEFQFFGTIVDQPGYAGQCAKEDVRKLLRRSLAVAFMRCYLNQVITQKILLTDEADAAMMQIKIEAGLEAAPVVVPAAPVLSPAEAYDKQILWDWENLPSDKVAQKRRESAQYRKRLAELLEGDLIKSQATQLHDGANL